MDFSALFPALVAVLVLGLITFAVWRLLRYRARKASAHTESGTARNGPHAVRVLPAPPPAAPTPPSAGQSLVRSAPQGPVAALMTYTKADESTRIRSLQIYSRNIRDGRTHSLNCRQEGERITKQFLLSRISRIELPDEDPPLNLTDSEEIRIWLERWIPEHAAPPAKPSPKPKPSPRPLMELLPDGARGFAVLDLETTGTGRSCRIVEIALVRLDPQGRITEEWETLVHPGGPIPNGHVHGIDDALVAGAPSFCEIAGTLAAKLHEHVLVAHNLRNFDGPILEAHFAEVSGVDLSLGEGVDTMPTPRIKLVDLCARHGVVLDGGVAHTALGDTRALAQALRSGMAHLQPARCAVAVKRNGLLEQSCRTHTRAMAANTKPPKGWSAMTIQLQAGQMFVTTGPKSVSADTEIKRAEAHGMNLGLTYRKANAIPKRTPPAFLLSTSLTLDSRKMREAREQRIPIVLCRDFVQAHAETSVRAWRYGS